jgi:aspartate 1-decarboxylase
MKVTMLKSKLHKARVTDRHLDYEGSTTIDRALLDEVGILPHEQIQIYNMSNGNRFETYAIEAPAGSRQICVNGAAALLVEVGDDIIIASYALCDPEEARTFQPAIAVLNDRNEVIKRV